MKKSNFLFTALLFALTAMSVDAFAITVSGTVSDDIDVLSGATVHAVKSDGSKIPNLGVLTGLDGHFQLEIPDDAQLQISFIGYKAQTVTPGQNLNIKLVETSTNINDVEVTYARKDGDPCSDKLLTDPYAAGEKGEWKKINDTLVCVPTDCKIGYRLKNYQCVEIRCDEIEGYEFNGNANKCEKTNCSYSEKQAIIDANGIGPKWDGKNCVPTECASNYHLTKDKKCVHDKCSTPEEDWNNEQKKCVKVRCTDAEKQAIIDANGTSPKWDGEKCVATKCKDETNYKLGENGTCVANDCPANELTKINATTGYMENGKCIPITCKNGYEKTEQKTCENQQLLKEKQKVYDEAKAKEQSTANKTLTALTTAATGIGGMELLQGMSEKSADSDAAADMTAYIETMNCSYGEGERVKASTEEIELPGANDQTLMNLRAEYLALAQDLKERKQALGLTPGIESEEILDRASSGLYDDETIGITGGSYASLYRAQALDSETDQAKIDDAASTSKNRVIAGAVVAGVGVVGGVVGNQLINGKKSNKNIGKEEKALWNQEDKAKENLKKCLKAAEISGTDDLDFVNFYPSILSVKNIDCKKIKLKGNKKASDVRASEIFADSNNEEAIFGSMNTYFDMETISKLVGFSNTETESNIKEKIKLATSTVQKKFDDARKKDERQKSSNSEKSGGLGLSSIAEKFMGGTGDNNSENNNNQDTGGGITNAIGNLIK